ncbi:hypothetical protein [Arachidicoccus ginsenosidivorans]|uniref:hypothetical protein n=1 Tax=Arachidicoccus ginsenosidivorans TaxID=496057 RepID=UPI001315548E|nr:hypothetical protein [Arachidicoccus ginsenosidivorans]
MIKIGIIEDDEIIRQSLVDYFTREAGFEVSLHAASVETFMSTWGKISILTLSCLILAFQVFQELKA